MWMEGHQTPKGLYEQYKPWFTPRSGLPVGLVQQSGYNAAERTQPMALMEVGSQQLGDGKDILPMRNRQKHLLFHPITIGQHAFLE